MGSVVLSDLLYYCLSGDYDKFKSILDGFIKMANQNKGLQDNAVADTLNNQDDQGYTLLHMAGLEGKTDFIRVGAK